MFQERTFYPESHLKRAPIMQMDNAYKRKEYIMFMVGRFATDTTLRDGPQRLQNVHVAWQNRGNRP
jgi:hypothetical protein